jgi:hypothetical protein
MSRSPRRHALALLVAFMLLVGCPVGAEAISGVSFSPGGSITQTGTFTVNDISGRAVECPVTLSGSFSSTLVSVAETTPSVGSYTGLASGTCARGSITSVLNLPSTLRMVGPARTAPAGNIVELLLMSSIGIRVRMSSGIECLLPGWSAFMSAGALGNNEYSLERTTFWTNECVSGAGIFSLAAPSPRQVATFLRGNEVINGFTPSPVVFGTVRVGELTQRTVTIGYSAGGRLEEIVVTTQSYFAITDPNGCRGRTLEARGTCDINVILSAPTEAGRSVSDTLTVRIAERRFEGTLRAST